MLTLTTETPTPAAPAVDRADPAGDFDLDVRFIEAGDTVEHLIYMTNDGCGSTCQSACPASCR